MKVSANYKSELEVQVPSCIEEVKAAFADIMKFPWVTGICLTGSILCKGATPSDIDVLLVVTDLKAFLDARRTIVWPSKIGDLSVDVFASEQKESFFMSLDLMTLKLYKSKLYNVVGVDPRIAEVIDTGKAVYADKATLADPATKKPQVTPCRSCGRAEARRNKE